jgi:hypothetical protein
VGGVIAEQAADILDEDAPGPGLDDEAAQGWPEVAGVIGPGLLSGHAVRLARDARKNDVHAATKSSAWDGSGITPNRRRIQGARLNRFDQSRDGEGLPLHVEDRTKAWNCDGQSKVEGGGAGAEADGVEVSGRGM